MPNSTVPQGTVGGGQFSRNIPGQIMLPRDSNLRLVRASPCNSKTIHFKELYRILSIPSLQYALQFLRRGVKTDHPPADPNTAAGGEVGSGSDGLTTASFLGGTLVTQSQPTCHQSSFGCIPHNVRTPRRLGPIGPFGWFHAC